VGRYAKLGKATIAYELLSAYPLGKSVTVYYPPDKPEEAVLKSGLGISWLLRYALLIIVPVFTLGLFTTAGGPAGAVTSTLTAVNDRFLPVTAPIASYYGLSEDNAYLVLGVLFLLIVFFLPLVFITLRNLTRLIFSLGWKQTDGEVIVNRLQDYWRGSGEGRTHYFRPVVQYLYKVDDKNYTSTRLSWVGHDTDEKRSGLFPGRRAKAVLKRYPVGTSVSVRYDSSRPYVSALRIRMPIFELLIEVVIIAVVVLFLLFPREVMLIFFSVRDSVPKRY
jgi:hypothetical protein